MTFDYRKLWLTTLIGGFIGAPGFSFAESRQEGLSLEEILVTAQKREESNKHVPVSISVMGEESIDNIFSAGDDVQSLSGHIPGLYIESSNGRIAPRFYLRGLGNVDFDLSASQPVSVVYDNVVMENVILKSTPLFDIESVEVSRGPQGTLFGRNTTAGVVAFTSKRPSAETDVSGKLSYGSYDSVNFESAVGGTLVDDKLFARFSMLAQSRGDWIDNAYTGEKDAFGGHEEYAGRVQLLYMPVETFSALLNVHARDLDGSQTAFRANVFDKGSNEPNENYNRNTVFYDGGNNNTQQYDGSGASLTLDFNLGEYQLTTISAFEKADGSNTGDIDGGVAGVGPGFIPFSSETVDAGDIEQTTHEIRLANTAGSFWTWQVGAFYFDSDLSVFTDAGFNSATVYHANKSTAIFAHNSFNFDRWILSAGVRYTDDKKEFSSNAPGVNEIDVSEHRPSWDLSATWLFTDAISFYTRVADGFRAPSIQGRNVAFFGQPSVAKSEEALSVELGVKGDFFSDTLRLNAAVFSYDIDNFQLSAIGGTTNSNELMNADSGKGQGIEADIEYLPTPNTRITFGYTYADTEIRDSDLFTAVCGSGQCTVTDPVNSQGFANINGNPFPGAPKTSANLTFYYQMPIDAGRVYFMTDWIYSSKNNLALYESKEFVTDSQFEGGLRIGFKNRSEDLDVSLFARNVTDEDNVKGFVDFNNNTGFFNEPRFVGVEIRKNLF